MRSWRGILVGAVSLVAAGAAAEVVERVVARVGGDIITLSDFTNRQAAAAQAARVSPDKVEVYLRENNVKILQDAIDELLLVQRAADLGFRMRPEYIDQIIEDIKKENKIATEEDFSARLRAEGLTLADLKRNIERQTLRDQVIRKDVTPKVTVSDAEARAEYEKRKADFTKPATVHLQEILVAGPNAQTKAKELVTAIRSGADFAETARKNSTSPTASNGGDLGELPAADLSGTLSQQAAKLKPGEVSEPFADAGGYRIVRLVARAPAVVRPFDEVRQEINRDLMKPRWEAEYEKYVADLRATAAPMTQVMLREVPTDVTVSPQGSILSGAEPAAPPPDTPAAADSEAEIQTSPQSTPDRVAPAPAPTSPVAAPTSVPFATPTPGPNVRPTPKPVRPPA